MTLRRLATVGPQSLPLALAALASAARMHAAHIGYTESGAYSP